MHRRWQDFICIQNIAIATGAETSFQEKAWRPVGMLEVRDRILGQGSRGRCGKNAFDLVYFESRTYLWFGYL